MNFGLGLDIGREEQGWLVPEAKAGDLPASRGGGVRALRSSPLTTAPAQRCASCPRRGVEGWAALPPSSGQLGLSHPLFPGRG